LISRSNRRLALGALAAAVVASRWLLRARVPDDYDSFGFILGMSGDYDLARFQPHFPGYPVYVALGAALCRLGAPALAAATAISALASGVAALCLAICAERFAGPRAAVIVVALHLVAWLPWLLGAGALSESLAVALTAAACALLLCDKPVASGFFAGLLLGARASYWPIALSLFASTFFPRSLANRRYRFCAGAAAGVLLWAIPLLVVVGPRRYLQLGTTHLAGHFGQWGGSVVTRPDLFERARAFVRGLLLDGLAPSPVALAAIAIVVAAAIIIEIRRSGATARGHYLKPVLALLLPYALWAFFAQNIVEQPRHLLPLVEGGLVLLACVLAPRPLAAGAVCLLAAAASAPLALRRHVEPPAAAQAAAWVAEHQQPSRTTVAAGRSSRFFEALGGSWSVRQHVALADVIVDLSRFDRFPETILLTSDIDVRPPLPARWRLRPGPRFCRDPRIDRAQPCLALSQLNWSLQ
jgi:hypothetical protein